MKYVRAAWPYVRLVAVVVLLLCAAVLLRKGVDPFSRVKDWLVWRLLVLWGYQVLFVAGCLSFGSLVVWRLVRDVDDLPGLELTVLAMATGVVALGTAIYIVGAMHLLGPESAILIPLGMAAAGLRWSPGPGRLLRFLRSWRPRLDPLAMAILAFGILGAGSVYLHILDPNAAGHDAHWTHLVIAQDIAREGRLVWFPADWAKNFPHFASMVYAWCFLLPGLSFSMRMLMAMHAEFVLLLFTLAAVTAAVRWLLGSRGGYGLAWAGFFLFANIMVYDSNLCASADHIAAFFVLPMCLAAARGVERSDRRGLWALAGLLMGAALSTKLQCAYLALIVCGLVSVNACARAFRSLLRREGTAGLRRHLGGPLTLAGFLLIGAAPHLIERTVFYSNPFYPMKQELFRHSKPAIPDSPDLVNHATIGVNQHCPTGKTWRERVKEELRLSFTFAFEPHYTFNGDRPTFGFLFTLLSPLVLLLPNSRRLRLGALTGIAAVFAWAATRQIDRNLQIAVPVLAAVTIGTMVRVWGLGWIARLALGLPVLLQVAWNTEALYEPIEPRLEQARLAALGHGHGDAFGLGGRQQITAHLPENAVVLLHYQHMSLGLDRTVLHDTGGFQGLIDQRPLHTARALYDRYRELGITHLVWDWQERSASPQEQIAFAIFASLDAVRIGTFGANELAAMPEKAPPTEQPYRTLALGLGPYEDGIYTVDQLNMFENMPFPQAPEPRVRRSSVPDLGQLVSDVDVALFASDHPEAGALVSVLAPDFDALMSLSSRRLYIRRSLRASHGVR